MNAQHGVADDEDRALRPTRLDQFEGQPRIRGLLHVCTTAAKSRGGVLDHVLLAGGPGLGKTTLAGVVAAEMSSPMVTVNAPTVRSKGELAAVLTSLRRGDVLFIDEIHSLDGRIEEILYPAMEDYRLEIVAGNKPVTVRLEPFTLVGATTRLGRIQAPLRARFGIHCELEPYGVEETARIASRSARKLGMELSPDGALEVARRSRGTPRVTNRILRRVRDFAFFHRVPADSSLVGHVCQELGIDEVGLDKTTRRYLEILVSKGTAVSQSGMIALLGESRDVIEEVVEPTLLAFGFIEVQPRGRCATARGRGHVRAEH